MCAKSHFHEQASEYADRLQQIFQEPVENKKMVNSVQSLKEMEGIFAEVREILRLEKTEVYKQDIDKKNPDTFELIVRLKEQTSNFRTMLSERLENDNTTSNQKKAIRIAVSYFDKYEHYLFDHFFITSDTSGNELVKLIERTNSYYSRLSVKNPFGLLQNDPLDHYVVAKINHTPLARLSPYMAEFL